MTTRLKQRAGGQWRNAHWQPRPPQPPAGTSLDAFESGWSQSSGTQTLTYGADHLKVQSAVNTANTTKALTFDLTDQGLALRVRRNANLYRFRIFLTVDQTDVNTTSWASRWVYDTELTDADWTTVTFPLATFTPNGTAPPTTFADVREVMISTSRYADTVDVDYSDLRAYPQTPANGPGVVWMFDDGVLNTYDVAYPQLAAIGHVGVIGVPPTLVGSAGYMTSAQLHELEDAGWQIAAHGTTSLTSTDEAGQIAELEAAKSWLLANGFDPDGAEHFVYIGGHHDDAVVALTLDRYRTARTTADKAAELPWIANKGRLGTRYVERDQPTTFVTSTMDDLAAHGGVSIISLHSLLETPTNTYDWHASRFTEAVAYADALGLASYTLADLYPR